MKSLLRKMLLALAVFTLSGATPMLAEPFPVIDSSNYLSSRASTLLAEIQSEAAQMGPRAETLGSFAANPQFSWQSHAFYLEQVKGHINAVGDRITELQQISDSVEPWQQQAIDRVTSHAAQVASSTESAITYLRANQDRFFVPEYRDHLKSIAKHSENMKQTVSKYLSYEKARQNFQELQRELEL